MKQKESSPVRNFLDDDSMTKEAFQGVNKDNQDLEFILHPEMIGNNKI